MNKRNDFLFILLCALLLVTTYAGAMSTRTFSYSYDPVTSRLARLDGPRTDVNDVTRLDYAPITGNLIQITNALGHQTFLSEHDPRGRPRVVVDPNGVVTTFRYHPRGGISQQSVDGEITRYDYDQAGLLERLERPDGQIIHYAYDAAQRLTGIQDNQGHQINYSLDALGNMTGKAIRDNQANLSGVWDGDYDQRGRLRLSFGGEGQLTAYHYDANGNRIAQSHPQQTGTDRQAALNLDLQAIDRTLFSSYDALNRRIHLTQQQLDPDVNDVNVSYFYNALNQLEAVVDPNGLETRYRYNAFGDLLQQDSPDSGTTTYQYDEAGNRILKTDARGVTVHYRYDALNRLILSDFPGTVHDIQYRYDEGLNGIGHLTGMEDGNSLSRYRYDSQGRLIEAQQELDFHISSVRYQYETGGHLGRVTFPSGHQVTYHYNNRGQMTGLSADINGQTRNLVSNIDWHPSGQARQYTYGNGLDSHSYFDLSFRLYAANTSAIHSRLYEYNPADYLEFIRDDLDKTNDLGFQYDALDRLREEAGSDGYSLYDYDQTGNRIKETQTDVDSESQSRNYHYEPDSHRLIGINGRKNREYDAMGNTLSTRNGRDRYQYNVAGRLEQFYRKGKLKAHYLYNGFGQRIQKTLKKSSEIYSYTPDGKLLSVQIYKKNQKTVSRDNIWFNGQVIAQIRTQYKGQGGIKKTRVLFLHHDHLKTPRFATDSEQKIVWRWDSDAFGTTKADSTPDQNKTKTTINLRFPGQYYDRESGLHYNYYRYYDPQIGRYITSDPIGLDGGLNTYGYAIQNPLKYIDPDGRIVWLVIPGICAGGGCEALLAGGLAWAVSNVQWPDNLGKPIDPWEDTNTEIEVPTNILPPEIPDQCEVAYKQEIESCNSSCSGSASKVACIAKAKFKLWICKGAKRPKWPDDFNSNGGNGEGPEYSGF